MPITEYMPKRDFDKLRAEYLALTTEATMVIEERDQLRADLAASQAECERHGHLFWLAARDVVFFSTYNEDIKDWDNGWHAAVNCNDTFYYASADATHLAPGRECEVRAAFDRWEWAGVVAWCAIERGEEPLEQLRTEKYRQARAAIDAARAGKGE